MRLRWYDKIVHLLPSYKNFKPILYIITGKECLLFYFRGENMELEVLDILEKEKIKEYDEESFLIVVKMNILDCLRVLHAKPIQNASEIKVLNHSLLLLEERLRCIQSK